MESTPERTNKPIIAGILTIIAGALNIMGTAFIMVFGPSLWLEGTIPILIFGILTIVGGVFALKRRKWGLALAGSIAALIPNAILGVVAIIFTALSKQEFEKDSHPKDAQMETTPQRTNKPMVAGILTIIVGTIHLMWGVMAFIGPTLISILVPALDIRKPTTPFNMDFFSVISISFIVLGILAIVGGIFAIKRKMWGIALAGSIAAIISGWSIVFNVLGIIATVFIAKSKKEFA